MKRIRMHSAAAMEGRIFIQFISLLITTRLKQVMNEAGWFKDYDLQEVLNEMKTVRTVSILLLLIRIFRSLCSMKQPYT